MNSTLLDRASITRLRLVHAALSALAVAPLYAAKFPPLYDYYHWLFQGHLVGILLGPAPDPMVTLAYRVTWLPVPNLAAPLLIGALDRLLGWSLAGRVVLVLCVLAFAHAFAYLVRCVHRRPTALELVGYPWAYGYLLYKGYLSNQLSLAIAFVALGRLERRWAGERRAAIRERWIFAVLAVLAYVTSFFGWCALAAFVGARAAREALGGRRREALWLLLTQLPTLALAAVYALGERGAIKIELYDGLSMKLVSLVNPLMLFLRTDPLPPPFPVFWANLVGAAGLGAALVAGVRRRHRLASIPLGAAAGLLGLGAVLLPFYTLQVAGRPDERLAFAALLLLIAAVDPAPPTARRTTAVACSVAAILALHLVEYRWASAALEEIQAVVEAAIPPQAPAVSLTLARPRRDGACAPESGISFGSSALKWFDQARLLARGQLQSRIMQTSLLRYRRDFAGLTEHWVDTLDAGSELSDRERRIVMNFPFVVVYGCADDIDELRRMLGPESELLAQAPGVAVLHTPPVFRPYVHLREPAR